MNEVVIVSAVRTPIGKHGGSLKTMSAVDLTMPVMQELVKRSGVNPKEIDDIIWGCNYQKDIQGK